MQIRSMRVFQFLVLVIAAAFSFAVFAASLAYFKAQEYERARARLTLYSSTLEAELRHFAHLPFLLSLDPVVRQTLAGGKTDVLDSHLARFAESAGVDAIYLMDETGLTISASNAGSSRSFKGQNYGFRPYFSGAMRGELGEFYGIGATTGIPGYFYAMRVQTPDLKRNGVIAVKVDLSGLQESWQNSGEWMLLSNSDGVVLLASQPDWRYRTLRTLDDSQQKRILASRQFGGQKLQPLNWQVRHDSQTANIANENVLHIKTDALPNDWSLHLFVPDDQAVTRAWLTLAVFVGVIMLVLIASQILRMRRIDAALQRSEAEEAELRQANERLAVEIEERRSAELNLKKTQAELERAGRLAALGQLASSVTHELGQPIAAMKNQLAAAEMTNGSSKLYNKMNGLVSRMENITTQLKFFSRKGRDKFENCDLADIVEDALELTEPSVVQSNATVAFEREPGEFAIFANRLRIEQVVTNLVRNALDAVEEEDERKIVVSIGRDSETVWFTVADTGHGLGKKSFDELREPFATTRESGKGMGLGLTISAGIVLDHHGTIFAYDNTPRGAVFKVELPTRQRYQVS